MQIIFSSPKERHKEWKGYCQFSKKAQDIIILLSGDLGCGKTILAKGIATGLKSRPLT
jgi:tRNA A37 threonylcarbamoyladenosine biosynthesis protein TsaE